MPDEKPVKPEWVYTLKQRISDVEAFITTCQVCHES